MKGNTNTATDLQIDRTADNKMNGEITNPPKKEDSKKTTHTRQMNTVIQTLECDMAG